MTFGKNRFSIDSKQFHWNETSTYFSFPSIIFLNYIFFAFSIVKSNCHCLAHPRHERKRYEGILFCLVFFLSLLLFSLLVWNSRRLAGFLFDLTIFASFDSRICFGIMFPIIYCNHRKTEVGAREFVVQTWFHSFGGEQI